MHATKNLAASLARLSCFPIFNSHCWKYGATLRGGGERRGRYKWITRKDLSSDMFEEPTALTWVGLRHCNLVETAGVHYLSEHSI
jgi:hypothetical protein